MVEMKNHYVNLNNLFKRVVLFTVQCRKNTLQKSKVLKALIIMQKSTKSTVGENIIDDPKMLIC